jgi:hypothetical protein
MLLCYLEHSTRRCYVFLEIENQNEDLTPETYKTRNVLRHAIEAIWTLKDPLRQGQAGGKVVSGIVFLREMIVVVREDTRNWVPAIPFQHTEAENRAKKHTAGW